MGFYQGHDRANVPRPARNAAWRQFAGLVGAAVLGSVITAGVFTAGLRSGLIPAAAETQSGSAGTTAQSSGDNSAGTVSAQSASSSATTTTASVQNLSNTSAAASDTITRVFQQVEPAVVAVVNYQGGGFAFYPTQGSGMQQSGVGSGVLIKKDAQYGYFVTNNHVIAGADKLEVVLYTGTHVPATVVGADPYTDLAVLRVPVNQVANISPVPFADSSHVRVGELAIAIGTPGGLDFRETVTSGIVSGTQRLMPVEAPDDSNTTLDYQSVIQTDAPINPGNSGGPLLNANGQIIGINSSKIVAQGFEGMGFAIPSNEVRDVVQQIMSTGHVQHPALGITAYSLSAVPQPYWPDVPVTYGVYVYSVTSPQAQAAGLKAGDVIVGINGHTVQDEADLRTALFALRPGDKVSVDVYRGGQKLTLSVVLGSLSTGQQPQG